MLVILAPVYENLWCKFYSRPASYKLRIKVNNSRSSCCCPPRKLMRNYFTQMLCVLFVTAYPSNLLQTYRHLNRALWSLSIECQLEYFVIVAKCKQDSKKVLTFSSFAGTKCKVSVTIRTTMQWYKIRIRQKRSETYVWPKQNKSYKTELRSSIWKLKIFISPKILFFFVFPIFTFSLSVTFGITKHVRF